MKNKNIIDSFNNAIQGIIIAFKNERNMKIHSAMAIVVFFLSLFFDLSRTEIMILFLTVVLVVVTELVNTAIEGLVDIVVDVYNQKAKIIKDIAAGAVLLASANSVVIAYFLFYDRLNLDGYILLDRIRQSPVHITFIAVALTLTVVIIIKSFLNKGTPFHGGMPSGHTAIAFSIATAAALWSSDVRISVLCFVLAIIVMQSRIEGEIHSVFETIIGGLMGILITYLLFKLIM